ncbi:hypothetical protein C8R46DRAFT_920479, partial [Mycena filopes]
STTPTTAAAAAAASVEEVAHGVDIEMPPDAPPWLSGSVTQLSTTDLGLHFTALLATLVRMETSFGFDEDTYGTLPADNRPEEVSQWIKNGRYRKAKMPGIKSLTKYMRLWDLWWGSLQPGWRRRDRGGKLMAGGDAQYGEDDDWGSLLTPGPNGCLSIVASLYLWGQSDQQTPESREEWNSAVQGVMWMLEGVIAM